MISCPKCQHSYESKLEKCPACSFSPTLISGIKSWDPDLAESGSGFKSESFYKLYQAESSNFWFIARNQLIKWAIEKYSPNCQSFLEIGCGTGFVLSCVRDTLPLSNIVGSEIFTAGLAFAAERVPEAELVQMDARNLPYKEEFDVVSAFDVIEHIDEDVLVLKNLFRSLKPGGLIMITVPQHQWLWSLADENACHVRRYNSAELHEKVEKAGFSIVKSTSFVSLLLPAMYLSRFKANKNSNFDPESELNINSFLNYLFVKVLSVERFLIRIGIRFPFGGSRLVIARKDNTNM